MPHMVLIRPKARALTQEESVAQAVGLLRGDEVVSVGGKGENAYRLMEALEDAASGQVEVVVRARVSSLILRCRPLGKRIWASPHAAYRWTGDSGRTRR